MQIYIHIRREPRQIILNQGFFLPRSLPTCGEGIEQKITESWEMSIQRRSELISHCPSLKAKWGKKVRSTQENRSSSLSRARKKVVCHFHKSLDDPLSGARVYKREKRVTHCGKSLNKTRYATKMPQISHERCAYTVFYPAKHIQAYSTYHTVFDSLWFQVWLSISRSIFPRRGLTSSWKSCSSLLNKVCIRKKVRHSVVHNAWQWLATFSPWDRYYGIEISETDNPPWHKRPWNE